MLSHLSCTPKTKIILYANYTLIIFLKNVICILWRHWCIMMTDLCLLISTTWCINALTILAKSPKANKHFLIPGFICLQYFKLLEIINNNPSSPLFPWPFRMKRAIKFLKKRKTPLHHFNFLSVWFIIFQ